MSGSKHKSCRLLDSCHEFPQTCPNFDKFHVIFGNQSPSPCLLTPLRCAQVYILGVCWGQDAVSERVPVIIHRVIVLMLLLDSNSQAPECRQSATVDAFCRQCVRGGVFYGAPFVTCLEGCCCKSCVIYKKQVLLSARFHLLKPQRRTNRLWPAAIPPWNFFLYQTALLSTLPFTLGPPPAAAFAQGR